MQAGRASLAPPRLAIAIARRLARSIVDVAHTQDAWDRLLRIPAGDDISYWAAVPHGVACKGSGLYIPCNYYSYS